ncbi:MAG: exodeoxyribonuclease VII large subunit [Myxococcota bacterium]|nr:exodeoxyribonuclease VII large subunit [Myxococcota bacterium]
MSRGALPSSSVLSVSQLQASLRRDMERKYPNVMVEGEISNLTIHHLSGHAYFTLKDSNAQLRCVMWRNDVRRLKFRPENGQQVICTGKVTVYERGGTLQLSAQKIEMQGLGALQAAYRQLAELLRNEGWTSPENKKDRPIAPKTVGIVTSRQAAALRDIVRTIRRRNSAVRIIIAHTAVQGDGAANQIAEALERMDKLALADVIILSRGGGSIEDLWAFNEEPVARAIIACSTPIVTGIGHETDTTIADLVADHHSSTPTAAAEECVADENHLSRELEALVTRLNKALTTKLELSRMKFQRISDQLDEPGYLIHRREQDIDDLLQRAESCLRDRLSGHALEIRQFYEKLLLCSPRARQLKAKARLDKYTQRQQRAMENHLGRAQQSLARRTQSLELLSPLNILSRGYSIATTESGQAVRSSSEVTVGERLNVRFADGNVATRIETLDP